MDGKKEKKGFWQSWMAIAVLAVLTIMVFLFNSQSPSMRFGQDENISTDNITGIVDNGTNITDNITGIVDNGTNITDNSTITMDNDTIFKNLVQMNLVVILENLNCISDAGKIRNFNATERCGKFLSENSNIYIRNARGYNVSPSLQPILGEYKNALEYYNIGGTRLEIGARNRNLSQMGDAIEYIQNGTVYINRVTEMLYGNDTYNTTSNTSSNTTSNTSSNTTSNTSSNTTSNTSSNTTSNTSSNTTFIHPKITNTNG